MGEVIILPTPTYIRRIQPNSMNSIRNQNRNSRLFAPTIIEQNSKLLYTKEQQKKLDKVIEKFIN